MGGAIIFFAFIFIALFFILFGINPGLAFSCVAVMLGILIFYRNYTLSQRLKKTNAKDLHITNIEKGGVFKLTGVKGSTNEMTLKVLDKHLYQEGDFYWYELECDKGEGEKVWVDVEEDDEVVVSIVLEKLSLNTINTNSSSLKKIDDEEIGSVSYKGTAFRYVESDEAIFYRSSDDSKKEKLYYWDFQNGSYSIGVEKWGINEYQVFYCQQMKPSQVTVYSLR